jgi:hypothetical protein
VHSHYPIRNPVSQPKEVPILLAYTVTIFFEKRVKQGHGLQSINYWQIFLEIDEANFSCFPEWRELSRALCASLQTLQEQLGFFYNIN